MSDCDVTQLAQRWGQLKTERSTWWTQWYDLSKNILPVNGRFFVTDRNKGWKRYNNIYDNTGGDALNTLAAGMMSGMTSPSRPWFALSLTDRDLMQSAPVKIWLADVTAQIQEVFARSNIYRVLHSMYEELGTFGTAAALIADDYQNIIHLHPFTIGEYAISTDWKGDVTTLYREFEKPVAAVVKEFGLENCSKPTQAAFQRGMLDAWVSIMHAIEPREDRDCTLPDAKNMAFKSVYWERGHQDKPLRESGYKSFPCVCPRWKTVGGDIYGVSPGMYALGDIKGLQTQEYRKLQAIDYKANPPVQVPSSMKNRELELFPGGISYYDASAATQGIKTAFEVNLDIRELLMSQQDTRQRINAAFYKDLFLMISSQPADGRMTATEVMARNEEKMLMLGPVVERLNNELLDPLVSTVFERLLADNRLKPAPEEMSGHHLNVEYISMLAQAQKSVAINGIDRFVSSLGQVATLRPDVLDKFNVDHWADICADKLGIDPALIIGNDKVAIIRQQHAQAQQQAQQQQALLQASQAVRNVGSLSTQPGTAAGDIIQHLKGQQQ